MKSYIIVIAKWSLLSSHKIFLVIIFLIIAVHACGQLLQYFLCVTVKSSKISIDLEMAFVSQLINKFHYSRICADKCWCFQLSHLVAIIFKKKYHVNTIILTAANFEWFSQPQKSLPHVSSQKCCISAVYCISWNIACTL